MNDKHLEQLKHVAPPMPDAYLGCINATLLRMEDMNMKKRAKVSLSLVAALVAVLVLSGIAFAMTNSSIRSRLFVYQEEPEETNLPILQDIASTSADGLSMSIDEALYDGSVAYLDLTVASDLEEPVFVNLAYEFTVGSGKPEVEDHSLDFEDHIIRMLDGKSGNGYFTLYIPEAYIGLPLDVKMTCTFYRTGLKPGSEPSETEVAAENNALYYTPEEAARREAEGIIMVSEEGFSNIGRYPTYQEQEMSMEPIDGESDAEFAMRCIEASGLMTKIDVLVTDARIEPQSTLAEDVYILSAPVTVRRNNIDITVTDAVFTPISTRIQFETVVPKDEYDPETNEWLPFVAHDTPLLLTNDAGDPLTMDLGIQWDGIELADGSYKINGIREGRPMAGLGGNFYVVASNPDMSWEEWKTDEANAPATIRDYFRQCAETDDTSRKSKLELVSKN